ncbi:hypothetical protein LMH47_11085, partial [Neisseria gonorrhoeae]|nr:hypothetical protein [Neisseria gonorrhoeae]
DDIAGLVHDAEQHRRQSRDLGFRLEKNLLEAESTADRARVRLDSAIDDLDRVLLLKHGDPRANDKRSIG